MPSILETLLFGSFVVALVKFIRDYLKKHRDDDPEPIEVHVWYDEYYKSSTAHVIYEGEEYSVPASLAYGLDGAVFDGMTIMTGVIDVQ